MEGAGFDQTFVCRVLSRHNKRAKQDAPKTRFEKMMCRVPCYTTNKQIWSPKTIFAVLLLGRVWSFVIHHFFCVCLTGSCRFQKTGVGSARNNSLQFWRQQVFFSLSLCLSFQNVAVAFLTVAFWLAFCSWRFSFATFFLYTLSAH